MYQDFLGTVPEEPTNLDEEGSWGKAAHVWMQFEFDALAVAGYSGRPLLVRGEPGSGKSQIARAAARLLNWRFDYEVISPRLEPQDLLWRYDAVRRLAQSHRGDPGDDEQYVTPGLLWRALDPVGAAALGPESTRPEQIDERPCVVLLDEIDKADADLPNSLLEVLGNRGFKTPWGQVPSKAGPARPGPLVVITSNNERELPLAFMRRCVVLDLLVPDENAADGSFEAWLIARGTSQFGDLLPSEVIAEAARLVRADRKASPEGQGARPGLAEYLDLLRALSTIAAADPATSSLDLLRRLSPYVLRKQGQPQSARPA